MQRSFSWAMRIFIGLLCGCAAPSYVVLHGDRTDDSARIDAIIDSTKPPIAVALLESTNEQRIDFDMKSEVFGPQTPGAGGIALAWDADPLAPEPQPPAARPVTLPSRLHNNPWWNGGVPPSAPPTSPASAPPSSTPVGPPAARGPAPAAPHAASRPSGHH